MGRLIWSLILLAAGVMAHVVPPNHTLWYVSLAVTEWGYWLLIPIALVWWPGWQRTTTGRVAAGVALVAAVLLVLPLWKARSYAQVIEPQAAQFFRDTRLSFQPGASPRPSALVFRDLVQGVAVPAIDRQTRPYATRGMSELQMDVYEPPSMASTQASGAGHPVVILLHGGFGPPWQSGSRQEAQRLNRYLAGQGYYVMAIDYRLATDAPYPAALEDAMAALRAVKDLGRTGSVDPSRIVLIGRGGGAHLALLTAYLSGDPSIRGVVALYPPTDLSDWYRTMGNAGLADWQGWLRLFLGGPLDPSTKAMYEAASPRTYARTAPPTLLIHGQLDPIVPVTQTDSLTASLQESSREVFTFRLPWATHACDLNFQGPCGQATTFLIERFLARYSW